MNEQPKEPEFIQIGDEKVPLKGVLGVRQVDEDTVEIRYAGPTFHVKGTSSQVLRKLQEAKGIKFKRR